MRFQAPIEKGDFLVDWRTLGPFATNAFLLICHKTKEAALIDASAEPEKIQEMIDKHQVSLRYLLQTHAHLDHVGALSVLKRSSEAPIYLHKQEMSLYDSVPLQCRLFGLPEMAPPPPVDHFIEEGDSLPFGDTEIQVIETPGHTPGGVTFLIGQFMFCGDTLFSGSVGRTDLPGGDSATLHQSLVRLSEYPENTIVCSGHGPMTTIHREKQYNPFLS